MPLVDDVDATTDFLNIPIDGLKDTNKLDKYLSKAIKKVTDPIKWWWDHQMVYPKLSAMTFNFLSVPGMLYLLVLKFQLIIFKATSTTVECLFLQGQHLLHFTWNRMSPSMIHAFLCLGDWGKRDLIDMLEIVVVICTLHLGKNMLIVIHSPLSLSLVATSFMFRCIFTTYIMPNITLFVHGLLYGSLVHHGFSTPWCLSKHLGFLPYPWMWCCHGCSV